MRTTFVALFAVLLAVSPAAAQDTSEHDRTARAILKELIEINTTDSSGRTTKAAEKVYYSVSLEVGNAGGHRHTKELWPGVIALPIMATGATDGLYLRNAGIRTYGVDGIFSDVDDVRSHGRDERIGINEFYAGREFLYRLVKTLGG
jgi:acetylornithine deacetylase/succinyl-diaminopimelate desuccinylase-like protein